MSAPQDTPIANTRDLMDVIGISDEVALPMVLLAAGTIVIALALLYERDPDWRHRRQSAAARRAASRFVSRQQPPERR